MNIKLKDGSIKEYANGTTVKDIFFEISPGLGRAAVAGLLDGEVVDLRTTVNKDSELLALTTDDAEGMKAYRHTASHIMAQAVQRLYPEAKLAIGPAIDNGFYYDFDVEKPFSPEDLTKIEKEMKAIVKANYEIERFELPRDEAIALMEEKGESYKVELINELPEDSIISFYKQDDFTDLCAGPHLLKTGSKKFQIKLLSAAGAYWKGSEKNKMLQRIYATAFEKKDQLDEYLKQLEEAKKRDHNKLGRELGYFTTNEAVGQGLPLICPKGAKTIQIMQRFVEDEEESRGYELTKTPYMAKSDLYKISGHWDHYKDGMFVLGDEEKDDEVLALRPMTCPFQFMIYKSQHHSYRDLPVRYMETSPLFRNEASGEMHGLIRVRQFTLADAHIMCRPDQLDKEFKDVLDLIQYIMKSLGVDKDVTYRFSKWGPDNREKYIDNEEAWNTTQDIMKRILDEVGLDYTEADDEAAFYGPKLDVQFKNVFGKEDTLFTLQVDFALADRFDMYYVDKNDERQRPYIIHRSSIGCYERTLAMLIEKYAGAMPLWISAEQIRILAITNRSDDYINEIAAKMRKAGLRVKTDLRNESIGYKIREARLEKLPYVLVVGDKEQEENTVAVRRRGEGEIGTMNVDEFISMAAKEDDDKVIFLMGKKVLNKQPNARDCFVCGITNDKGLKARFYETGENELVCLFNPHELHQSFPNRVHGGISAAILDELIGRCLQIGNPDNWAVTVELNVKYHKPLPYGIELKAVGRIDKDTRLLAEGSGEIYNEVGEVAVSAKAKYMKMPVDKITTESFEGDDWKVYSLPDDPKEV